MLPLSHPQKKTFLKNSVALCLFCIALSTACGFAFKVPSLYTFGQASGLSPMPTPFRDMGNGKESMHSTKKLFVTVQGVQREDTRFLDVFVEESRVRPHRALIPYIGIGNFAEAIPYALRERVLHRICTHFPNADALTLEVTYDNKQVTRTSTLCRQQ